MCACMDVPTQLELCLYNQLDIASLLLVFLLSIVIPIVLIISSFIFYCTIEPDLSALRIET